MTLDSVVAVDGQENDFEPTTKVTLTFNKDVEGLEAGHITVVATETDTVTAEKGTLVKAAGTGVYELSVDALLEAGPNAGKAFTVTVSDGTTDLSPSNTVTLYAWIAAADATALAAIGTDATTLAGWYKQTADITIANSWTPIGGTEEAPFTGHFVGSDYSAST